MRALCSWACHTAQPGWAVAGALTCVHGLMVCLLRRDKLKALNEKIYEQFRQLEEDR